MNILVTGGTGVISSGLVQESVNRGFNTYAVTRGNKVYRNIEGANYLTVDLSDVSSAKKIFEEFKFDIVIECIVYTLDELKKSLAIFRDKCDLYVFISSIAVFQKNEEDLYITEDSEYGDSDWWYTKEKIACELYLKKYQKNYMIIRPGVTYGNYRIPFPIASRNPVWTMMDRIINNQPIISCKNVKRSVMHISDFSKYVFMLLQKTDVFNDDFNVVASDQYIYWDDVIKIMAKDLGTKQPDIIHVPLHTYQVIYNDIYDELLYDKSKTQINSDHKVKTLVGNIREKKMEDGIHEIVVKAYEEFQANSLSVDSRWISKCEKVLIYAYIKEALSKRENEIVETYLINQYKISKITLRNLKKYIADIRCGNISVYVWGVGNSTRKLLERFPNLNIEGFMDSNVSIKEFDFNKKKYQIIHDPQKILKKVYIIVASVYYDDIARKLNDYKKKELEDYIFFEILY